MNSLILYKHSASPRSRAVMITGHILGINFDYQELNKNQNRIEENLDLNPVHYEPLLKDENEEIYGTEAIIFHLINKYGEEKGKELYPESYKETIDSILEFNKDVLYKRFRDITNLTVAGIIDGPSCQHTDTMDDLFKTVDAYLIKNEYLACDQFTIADICTGSTVLSIMTVFPSPECYTKIGDWFYKLKDHPSFMEMNAPGLRQFGDYINECWDAKYENRPTQHCI